MPQHRLLLPRDVPGVNAFELDVASFVSPAERPPPARPARELVASGLPVVFVVPSLLRLTQAAWLIALRHRPRRGFADTMRRELHRPTPSWRYDVAVLAWVDIVGPDRVQLVAGEERASAETELSRLAGWPDDPVGLRGWTRALNPAEVRSVESLAAELDALGLTGRNATDLLDGAAEQVLRTSPAHVAGPTSTRLGPEQATRMAVLAEEMLATVEAAGVSVLGDRAALLLPAPHPAEQDDPVALSAAVALSLGALERTASWAATEEHR